MKQYQKKTNSLRRFLIFLCWFLPVVGFAQPDYDFSNGSLESGIDRQVGAVYRFTSVRTGVDALVHIIFISPGITISEMDGASGYPEALQPTLDVQPWTTGHLEMRIDFVFAGTSTLMNQARVPVSCIDVDGILNFDGMGNGVHEYDEIDLGGGYVNYDLVGSELTMSQSGNIFKGINAAGIDYPGRDTSARQVMFTVVNVNISSAIIRVGVQNQSNNSALRLRSVYFKDFWYANGLMATSGLLQFTGSAKEGNTLLNWELAKSNTFVSITVERSQDGMNFQAIGAGSMFQGKPSIDDAFTDASYSGQKVYYRLRMHEKNGAISYSKILMIRGKSDSREGLRIYPNLVETSANLTIHAGKRTEARYSIVDMSGRPVLQSSVQLSTGQNTIQLTGMDRLARGTYVVLLTADGQRWTAKMVKQ